MNEILNLKTVKELCNYSFYVPAYQRGYRWTEKQIIDLLTDIDDFSPTETGANGEKSWYCLQPIVVRKDNQKYEVIDGQQRLTTIFLILHYLNSRLVEEEREREKIFDLNYSTRKKLPLFLKNMKCGETHEDNIDYYFISTAYKIICNWLGRKEFDKYNFRSKFEFNTKVIWFETNETDPITIFTRINMGKIPLTNAELIKALFLNTSNFKGSNEDKIRLKQLEISGEWDRIEQNLQDDSFWYFLTNGKSESNRIDFIFNIMNPNKDRTDTYDTFRFFSEKLKKMNESKLDQEWLEIKNHYQKFKEWFNERDLYHKIGFLVSIKVTIETLLELSKYKSKSEFVNALDDLIRQHFVRVKIDEIQYGDKKIKDMLLLYNIQTMLNNSSENSKFPFDIFKNQKWDIEHITSIKDKMPDSQKQQEMWLSDATHFIEEKKLKNKAENFKFRGNKKFEDIYNEIIGHFNKNIKDTDINDISNLALLDTQLNRGYKNAVFPVKRISIIQKEKSGGFVPLCTKNAFLKYFSEYPPKMSFWTQEDRDTYFLDIKSVLANYLYMEDESDE